MRWQLDCDVLLDFALLLRIIGTGPLREPSIPSVFRGFTGPMMHSAQWDSAARLENKIVGVVGCGSSAVQVIPSIAPTTKQLVAFIRNPSYAIWRPHVRVSRTVRLLFATFPFLHWPIRLYFFAAMIVLRNLYESGSRSNKLGTPAHISHSFL